MKKLKTKHLICSFLITNIFLSSQVYATGYPVVDIAAVNGITALNASVNGMNAAINASINAMNANLSQLLYNIGLAVNQNGDKIASTIEAAARADREFKITQEKNRRIQDSKQRHDVPKNICSESGSGGAGAVSSSSGGAKGGMRPGGGTPIGNVSIAQAINTPSQSQEIDAARAAKIHAQFCDADDYAAYGGSQACPSISSNMPGADKRIDSVLYGAGPNDKEPDLTFSQEQIDAARMYTQNSIRRSIGPQIRKGEADSVAGSQYIGLMNQYNATISAAADPQEQMIANSAPNPITKDLLIESTKSTSAAKYYKQMASKEARKTGVMSTREFEMFEVGRRYANTEYQADLQEMNSDNLLREQIRVTSLNNWLLLSSKQEIQRGNIINGQILATMARQEYEPLLATKYRAIAGSLGGK